MDAGINNRKDERKTLTMTVELSCEGESAVCNVVDISVGGAKIQSEMPLDKGKTFELNLKQFGEFESTIAWQNKKLHGLKFTGDRNEIAEALMAMALYG